MRWAAKIRYRLKLSILNNTRLNFKSPFLPINAVTTPSPLSKLGKWRWRFSRNSSGPWNQWIAANVSGSKVRRQRLAEMHVKHFSFISTPPFTVVGFAASKTATKIGEVCFAEFKKKHSSLSSENLPYLFLTDRKIRIKRRSH